MPSRRGSRCGRSQAPSSRGGTPAGIRRDAPSRQPPRRYGQPPESEPYEQSSGDTHVSESEENNEEISAYDNSPQNNIHPNSTLNVNRSSECELSTTLQPPSEPESILPATNLGKDTISLDDMRELFGSHEDDLVDRVVSRLNNQNSRLTPAISQRQQPVPNQHFDRIIDLENQLAQLRAERELMQPPRVAPRDLTSMYNPPQVPTSFARDGASAMVESVETMFAGVERGTLAQIIENRFKPTNIYRPLATEKERAETQRTINIGGIEFEQTERDRKESEHRMSSFFKAWATYSRILIKLAPEVLQGELATSLFIYTMSLYDLLEKYRWDGVKGYHFQFHRKRVAGGKSIYLPQEWRQLDSELIASKCIAHSII